MQASIYSNGSQECERMASLLQSLDGEIHKYELGKDFTQKQFQSEFGTEATYPQVSLGDLHIGDMKETLNYMRGHGLFV